MPLIVTTTTAPKSAAKSATTTTTTTAPSITKTAVDPHSVPILAVTPSAVPSAGPAGCSGVAMTRGQADIDAAPAGTTFCLSGTHDWTLTPKAGDTLTGPATLDGANTTAYAIVATAPNVTLNNLTIQHYVNGNQEGAIRVVDYGTSFADAANWHLNDLDVGYNSNAGSNAGNGWTFTGGRYHDNRQEGLGFGGNNVTVDGVELDHNNFTDSTYTKANISCEYEAGGMKFTANDVTVENSNIHDNACRGIWNDMNSQRTTITNNTISDNWAEGILIEISSYGTITGNTVTGNGFKSYGSACKDWLWDGGITLAESDHFTVSGNTLTDDCNGITGTQQNRPDGNPGLLENDTIQNNNISGPGRTGVAADNGANLTTRNIIITANTFTNGATNCALTC